MAALVLVPPAARSGAAKTASPALSVERIAEPPHAVPRAATHHKRRSPVTIDPGIAALIDPVAAARDDLDAISDRGWMHPPGDRLRWAQAHHHRAHTLLNADLQVRTGLILAHAHALSAEPDHARQQLIASFELAQARGLHGQAATAAALAMQFIEKGSDEWHRWAGIAQSHVVLADGDEGPELFLTEALASEAMEDDRFDEAAQHWERHIELTISANGPWHPSVAVGHSNLALVLLNLPDLERAEQAYRRALDIFMQTPGESSAPIAAQHLGLANVQYEREDWVACARNLTIAIRLTAGAPSDDPLLRDTQGESRWLMGQLMLELGRAQSALAFLRDTLIYLQPSEPFSGLAAHSVLADALIELGREREAIDVLEAGLAYTDPNAPEWSERVEARKLLAWLRARHPAAGAGAAGG